MATWDDVARLALTLPDTAAPKAGQWTVHGKLFVWERPLRSRDREDLAARGDAVPDAPIVAFRVTDEGEKHALVESEPTVFFTIPHFDGYAAVLARLERLDVDELRELITDAWLARAPKRLAARFLAGEA